MITQTMVQPSFWIEVGIQIQKVRGINLFKFNDELQLRLDLLKKPVSTILTRDRTAEESLGCRDRTQTQQKTNTSSHKSVSYDHKVLFDLRWFAIIFIGSKVILKIPRLLKSKLLE